ncbi:MAG: Rpn family recombination-promoting nuclease/putative transposase [Blautia sp.]|nr:Rpn family recombination-promoting nuclease/putative transposase [Blautia sp.]
MQDEIRINREHKDRLFRRIFSKKEDLLSLYNALNNSDYTNTEDLQIYTMDDFVYMSMRNDLSFLIDMTLNVFEHQSTYNPNMPLRGFFYMSSAYQKYIALNHLDIYSSKRISLPLSQYYVFYNGTKKMPDESTLLLTDSMPHPDAAEKSSAQFSAHMININAGHSSGIMQRCPKLYQYSLFIEEIRQNQKQGSTLREAVGTAVDSCI